MEIKKKKEDLLLMNFWPLDGSTETYFIFLKIN